MMNATVPMRDRLPWILCTAVVGALAAALGAGIGPRTTAPPGPNVVLIVADDLGFADINVDDPHTFHETPHLARLAKRGMRFTHGYATSPVCSPTRASLLTGKHPARLGITNVIATAPNVARAMVPAPNHERLETGEITIAEAFREAGYRTFISGKWHLGTSGASPSDNGFDSALVNQGQFYFPERSVELPREQDPKMSERIANDAVWFIDASANRPFFAFLSFPAPHVPLAAPPGLVEKYERKLAGIAAPRPSTANPVYAAMIEQFDRAIGRVLDAIESRGIADRTIVVLTSDNGGLEGVATSNAPLRGGKGTLHEGGIRVPWIVVAPGVASPGVVSEEPVITADLYPTLLELGGLPARPTQHVDGASIVPALRGDSLGERSLYWHFPHYSVGPPAAAIRRGDWKLIEWFEDGRTELFDLRNDVGETVDLAAREPERARALQAGLVAWRSAMHAGMPAPNPAWRETQGD